MIVRELCVGTPYKSKYDNINEGFVCMYELFTRILYTYKWRSDFGKINIILFPEQINRRMIYGNIIEYEIQFYFEEYIKLSNFDRRVRIIDIIHQQLIIFADDYNLDKTPVEETYKKCQELKYDNTWIHRNKKYPSPKKEFKVQLKCIWDETHLHVFILLFDKKGLLIVTHKWFDVVSRVGYAIYSYKGSFIDDYTFDFRDPYRYEKWKIDIRDLLESK